jgi:methyl-accepting chemotaxis protein
LVAGGGGRSAGSRELAWQLRHFTAFAGISISLLALVGGLGVGSLFLRRLDKANRSIHRIIHGQFSERLPRFGLSPEFDELTVNLNQMLERIEVQMEVARSPRTMAGIAASHLLRQNTALIDPALSRADPERSPA